MVFNPILDGIAKAAGKRRWLANISREEGLRVEKSAQGASLREKWVVAEVRLMLCEAGSIGFAQADATLAGFDAAELVGRAAASARALGKNRFLSVPDFLEEPPEVDLGIFDPSWTSVGFDEAEKIALAIEEAALGLDGRVFAARKPSFGCSRLDRAVAVAGQRVFWSSTEFSASVEVGARRGRSAESAWSSRDGRFLREIDPSFIGRDAAARACELLGGKKARSGRVAAVLDGRVAAQFLEVLAPSLIGREAQKGKSIFGRFGFGEKVISEALTVIDDSSLKGGIDTSPVDDEGSASRRNLCIDRGRLSAFLFDREAAKRGGAAPTGNGTMGPCSITAEATNFFISAEGGRELPELVGSVKRGVLIREAMGVHTIDSVSGDFSIGCAGLSIENGQLAAPFTGATISGNILDLFGSVEAVGGKIEFTGSIGSPALLAGAVDLAS